MMENADLETHDFTDPIDMLMAWYEAQGWDYERTGEEEVVALTHAAWGQYELRGLWRAEDHVLQFLALPDIKLQSPKLAPLYEAINLINEQLWLGHFELWSKENVIVFRTSLLLDEEEDGFLSLYQVQTLVETAVCELDRYYPVFQFVLWGGKSPKEALEAAMVETAGEA
jgi:hypothetical protein